MNKKLKITETNSRNESDETYHVPVLLQEVIDGLVPELNPGGVYVDCTFGGGGHSLAILSHLNASGRLIVFDQDAEARKNLPDDSRVIFIQQNFRHLQRFLRVNKAIPVDGILADLGVSSFQFNKAERGFSIRFDAALDMRMDKGSALTAAQILKTYSEAELHKLFEQYGEVTNSKTLARTLVEYRETSKLETINQLKAALAPIVKGNPNKYFAQVFQALRIAVNDELGALKEMLSQAEQVLKPGGRIAVISFHSIEDRIVKNFFKQGEAEEIDETSRAVFGSRQKKVFELITKKPIIPTQAEVAVNSRSRSAKLRIASKR